MTIDPADFAPQGKPTMRQARTTYDALSHQTCDALHAELTKRGFKVGRSTCARWIKNGFGDLKFRTKMNKGQVKIGNVPAPLKDMVRAEQLAEDAARAEAAIIGSELTPKEADDIQTDLDTLKLLDVPQLKAMLERDRLTYNIMMLRQAQRKADKLVLIPRDSAAFIVAMTDAAESVSTVPTGLLPGDGAKLIEGHANPPNPVSDAITLFKQRQGVKAA